MNTVNMAEIKTAELEEKAKTLSEISLDAGFNAAAVIQEYGNSVFSELDLKALVVSLSGAMNEVNAGDMAECERMLLGQAQALQSIFVSLTRRANKREYLGEFEIFFKLALKAQNQCRMTLETLATIKNPPVVYAKQANITSGPQQVNNGTAPHPDTACRARKISNRSNELLTGVVYGQQMDARTPETAVATHKDMDAMESIDRAKNSRGKG